MNYEEMSDFDINVSIAESLGLNWYCAAGDGHTGGWECCSIKELMVNDYSRLKDYCNNPSDAWPFIVGMISGGCIVQILQAGVIVTLQGGGHIQFMDKNPLRAAMIVFLMMQESK